MESQRSQKEIEERRGVVMSQRKTGLMILEYQMRHRDCLRRHPEALQVRVRQHHRVLNHRYHHRQRHRAVLAEEELREQLRVIQMIPEQQRTTCNPRE